jgi:hypothetical protein
MAPTTQDMEDRKEMQMNHTLVVKEEGPLDLRSVEKLKDVIFSSFWSMHTVASPTLSSSSSQIGMLKMRSLQLVGLWKVQCSSGVTLGA